MNTSIFHTGARQPFPQSLETTEGATYIIDRTIELHDDLQIADGVTLIFQGGRLVKGKSVPENRHITIHAATMTSRSESALTSPAKGVALIAPESIIFGKGISADGNWNIKSACPLWFEPNYRPRYSNGLDIRPDYSEPINNAITMKGKGEVFLPKGDYFISSPIFIPQGITLCGVPGQLYDHLSTIIYPIGGEMPEDGDSETALIYAHEYMVYINCTKEKEPIIEYSNSWEALRDISFINYPIHNKNNRCVFACYSCQFRNVKWYDFVQAVAYRRDLYTDGKSVINCATSADTEFHVPENLPEDQLRDYYLFDFSGLGDAITFDRNYVSSPKNVERLLFIDLCGGGSISDNILNSDIHIQHSKAIVMNGNHMESGAQIRIIDSTVSLISNYH